MLSPLSELTNSSPLTNSAATDNSERSSIRSAAVVVSPVVRERRSFRPNDCNQDLNNTAGDPFPDKNDPEYSLSCAESTFDTDCATESVPSNETAYARHKSLKTERGGTCGIRVRTGAIGATLTIVTPGPEDVAVVAIDAVVRMTSALKVLKSADHQLPAVCSPRFGRLLAKRDPLILRQRDLLQSGIAEQ